jgi:Tol biopolymer transport system component
MTVSPFVDDRELIELLADDPELLALADAVVATQAAPTARLENELARATPRRRRLLVIAAAALLVAAGAASAFGSVRDLLFGTGGGRTAWYFSPIWSPDGQRISYLVSQYRDGPEGVYVMNADGSGERRLSDEWGPGVLPVWSPDWGQVAFARNRCVGTAHACTADTSIFVMNADGTDRRKIARGMTLRLVSSGQRVTQRDSFTWSPDGRRLAYVSDRSGNSEIYVVNADGSGGRRLTRNTTVDDFPVWSPDGRRILFERRHGPRRELHVMNADGSGERMLARGWGGAWSPDGWRIAFRSDRDGNGEIYVMNADGSGQRRLTRNPSSDGGPVWSPDGRKLLFIRFRPGNGEIYVMNPDGSGQRNLTRSPGGDSSPAWSPDGRKIVFLSKRDGIGEVYVMNADGSGQKDLTHLKGEGNAT